MGSCTEVSFFCLVEAFRTVPKDSEPFGTGPETGRITVER